MSSPINIAPCHGSARDCGNPAVLSFQLLLPVMRLEMQCALFCHGQMQWEQLSPQRASKGELPRLLRPKQCPSQCVSQAKTDDRGIVDGKAVLSWVRALLFV